MGEAVYDLHSLGWHSFQQLSLTVASEILSQTVQFFSRFSRRDVTAFMAWGVTGH
jgi:hypothetical protein